MLDDARARHRQPVSTASRRRPRRDDRHLHPAEGVRCNALLTCATEDRALVRVQAWDD